MELCSTGHTAFIFKLDFNVTVLQHVSSMCCYHLALSELLENTKQNKTTTQKITCILFSFFFEFCQHLSFYQGSVVQRTHVKNRASVHALQKDTVLLPKSPISLCQSDMVPSEHAFAHMIHACARTHAHSSTLVKFCCCSSVFWFDLLWFSPSPTDTPYSRSCLYEEERSWCCFPSRKGLS